MPDLTYKDTGVDYDAMDPFKLAAQEAARRTEGNLARLGLKPCRETRGESVYLIEAPDMYLAHVEEGLGTKNLIADEHDSGAYAHIAQDTVAMIVNDMITLGALPISVAMHLAAGDSEWFTRNKTKIHCLVEGWAHACTLAGCVWTGGETPTLRGIVVPEAVVLAGSAVGVIRNKANRIRGELRPELAILIAESSGIHANGLTLARTIASKLPDGYETRISNAPDASTFGEALLTPTHIYVDLIERLQRHGVKIHYAVNVTGHGWRKFMRAPDNMAYVIDKLPTPNPLFDFIQAQGPVSLEEAYGNLNMGAGFAIYVEETDVPRILDIADSGHFSYRLYRAGQLEWSGDRRVVIKPLDLTFTSDTLRLR